MFRFLARGISTIYESILAQNGGEDEAVYDYLESVKGSAALISVALRFIGLNLVSIVALAISHLGPAMTSINCIDSPKSAKSSPDLPSSGL